MTFASGIDEIDFSADTIDSREIEARIDWLQGELADEDTAESITDYEREELTALLQLREELQGYAPDWHHGAILVADGYRKEYAQEYAEDIAEIPTALQLYIDWDKWGEDFFDSDWAEASVTYRGTEYNFTVRM